MRLHDIYTVEEVPPTPIAAFIRGGLETGADIFIRCPACCCGAVGGKSQTVNCTYGRTCHATCHCTEFRCVDDGMLLSPQQCRNIDHESRRLARSMAKSMYTRGMPHA
jgi:hypothetical protein